MAATRQLFVEDETEGKDDEEHGQFEAGAVVEKGSNASAVSALLEEEGEDDSPLMTWARTEQVKK